MSSLPADVAIWGFLFIGVLFSVIGLMGLVIFPDTRSRMFTAFRATAIGLGAVAFAVLTYAFTLYTITGGEQYLALILRTLFLVSVLIVGTWMMYSIIRQRTRREQPGITLFVTAEPEDQRKDGE
jgi:multisubunit Na+/H+ antiporter MnhG subunit